MAANEPNSHEIMRQNSMMLRRNSVQMLFNGYHFDFDEKVREEDKKKIKVNGTAQ